jgi:uncharacterized protein YhaN
MSKRTRKVTPPTLNIAAVKDVIANGEIEISHAVAEVNDVSAELSQARILAARLAGQLEQLRQSATYFPGLNDAAQRIEEIDAALAGARRDIDLVNARLADAIDKWRMLASYVKGMKVALDAAQI